MNINFTTLINLIFIPFLIVLFSCADLSIQNINEPDSESVFNENVETENNTRALSNDLFRRWYVTVHSHVGLQLATAVGADVATACKCPYGALPMGKEPRLALDIPNSSYPSFPSNSTPSFGQTSERFFNDLNAINLDATRILKKMSAGLSFSGGNDDPQIKAQAKLVQGLTTGYIALLYDQGFVFDVTTSIEEILNPTPIGYPTVMDHAIKKLEEVILISENNSFVLDDKFISAGSAGNTGVDNVFLKQIAHSFITRFLANEPRNHDQLSDVDWSAVKFHAEEGVKRNFSIYNTEEWYNYGLDFLSYPGYGRVDHFVINIINSSYPAHNTNGLNYPPPDSSAILQDPNLDDRLLMDYEYIPFNNFPADEGLYYFSNFRYSRNDTYLNSFNGLLPEITTSELDMYVAEALIYQPSADFGAAANIINNSERIRRGNMNPIQALEDEVWNAIHHERMVEQYSTGTANEFFHMRKYNMLQKGTVLHFPLPAEVQRTLGIEQPYTFGGEENADGLNTSNGGWR